MGLDTYLQVCRYISYRLRVIVANRLVLFRGTKLGYVYTDFRDDRDRGAVINAKDSSIRGTGRSNVAEVVCSWAFAFLVRHTVNRKGSKCKTSIT